MNKLLISTLATVLVVSFAVSSEAAGNADVRASCKAQAAKRYSAIHFMKRHNFVNNCVAHHTKAATPKAAKRATTGQAPKQ